MVVNFTVKFNAATKGICEFVLGSFGRATGIKCYASISYSQTYDTLELLDSVMAQRALIKTALENGSAGCY